MTEKKNKKILFISAGASMTGVPVFFVSMLKWMKANTNFSFVILTAGEGPLESEYHKIATTYNWDGWFKTKWHDKHYFLRLCKRIFRILLNIREPSYRTFLINVLKNEKFDLIYVNSVSSLYIYNEIKKRLKLNAILHVHELQISILQYCGIDLLRENISQCLRIIAISNAVAKNLKENYRIPDEKISIVYTFSDTSKAKGITTSEVKKIREELNIPENAILVGSGGTTEWRKGTDLLFHIANKIKNTYNYEVFFIWVGGVSEGLEYQQLMYDFQKTGLQNNVRFLGVKENPLVYFAAVDIFMLCSREEPVGMVALEAASLSKPILCFDQAGGMPEFVEDDCGFIIPYLDLDRMAEMIILLAKDRALREQLGKNAEKKVKRHDINLVCKEIETIINNTL
jgi:glycosyltransferase involved in cell wall biosynthesis